MAEPARNLTYIRIKPQVASFSIKAPDPRPKIKVTYLLITLQSYIVLQKVGDGA